MHLVVHKVLKVDNHCFNQQQNSHISDKNILKKFIQLRRKQTRLLNNIKWYTITLYINTITTTITCSPIMIIIIVLVLHK